ncbi:unnamed protein product [Prorocentrum cordatum]|uniref:60S acidic ribosomal protein P2 n=1 Tax=Prorocentrum cordatum TaxID=2364126 RepID=A0ABN9XHE8_9DINO|nr:unnamed protein product [Polarella glacialis]
MAMKYLGSYMLAVLGGKESPTAEDVKLILEAGGIACEDEMLNRLIERMEGKKVHELIAEGSKKFAACGGGGGGGGGGGAPAAGGGGGGGDAGAEKKEEKKVVEEEEEEDVDFDLFG